MRFAAAWIATLALVVACGAAVHPTAAQKPQAPTMMQDRPADLRAQITQLDQDITSRRDAAGLPPIAEAMSTGTTCTPPQPVPGGCTDVCTLGDSICDDASKICELAEQLPGDAWAAEKCANGKRACGDARQRCCECR